ncbi:MAG: hypothetical protein IH987_07075 [Planctomycetes bacterium]|nr:hypothetical protein [Planctomycetota bacterium]
MATTDESAAKPSLKVEVFYWFVVVCCTVIPWVLHFFVGWWVALLSIPFLFCAYDRLFVPPGALCMGIPFMIPLSSALALVTFQMAQLAKWIVEMSASG